MKKALAAILLASVSSIGGCDQSTAGPGQVGAQSVAAQTEEEMAAAKAIELAQQIKDCTIPAKEIQDTVGAQGHMSKNVLDISIARKDIGDVKGPEDISAPQQPKNQQNQQVQGAPQQVTFTPAFEIHGDLYFQPLCEGRALLNADMALREQEVNPFISALLKNGLVFQAFHQHLPMQPQIWFVHFRGVGDPIALAKAARAAIAVTSTPLPQAPPENPTTPLDAKRLADILHGEAEVGDEGVVTVSVNRKNPVLLGDVVALPETNISHVIQFKPLDGGAMAAVVPDFSMAGPEVQKVVQLTLNELSWYQGCLYNQETEEHPQLYFDHMVKVGDAYLLAQEIRRGIDLTQSE